jgi:murein DD-endopeptidase MepM/ murein hydrolase activator NlpD
MASINSAKFNGTRYYNGNVSHHQGLDLIAAPGTPIYAVADGRVLHCALPPGSSYGTAIILAVGIHDLPPPQFAQCQLLNPGETKIGFFYGHLSERIVAHNTLVTAGTVIGKTGCSGNASNMTTISTGAHLHFEVRKRPQGYGGQGLGNRADPLPFLKNCTND